MVWPEDLVEWQPAEMIQIPPSMLEAALDSSPLTKSRDAMYKKEKRPKKPTDHEAGLFSISCDCEPTSFTEEQNTQTIYVSGLAPDTTRELLHASFASCGGIRTIELVPDVRLPLEEEEEEGDRLPKEKVMRVRDGLESHLEALKGLLVDDEGQDISAVNRGKQNLTSPEEVESTLEEPKKVGLDGNLYKKTDFLMMYGEESWRYASKEREEEVRKAENGEFYSRNEFEKEFGGEAWEAAQPEQDVSYKERFAKPVKENKESIGAFVTFEDVTGHDTAVSGALRMLGVAINSRICYPTKPTMQRTLVIGWSDEFLSGHDAATEVKLMLRPYLGEVEVERVRGGKISCLYCFLTFSSFVNATTAKAAITEAIGKSDKYSDLRIGWALKYPKSKHRKKRLYD